MNSSFLKSHFLAGACVLVFLLTAAAGTRVHGHATDETYIWLNAQASCYDGRIEFCLKDLRKYLDMEIPEDYEAAREVILQSGPELEAYVRKHFFLNNKDGSEIPYEIVKIECLESDYFGHFAQMFFKTRDFDPLPSEIVVKSTFLFEHDRFSRCLLCMEYNSFTGNSHPERFHHKIFSPHADEHTVDFNDIQEIKRGRKYYIWEGIRHIWIGLDHILFLVTLLLASVLVKRRVDDESTAGLVGEKTAASGNESTTHSSESETLANDADGSLAKYEWVPVEGFAGAFWNIFKIVTVFTVAHSITLALASLNIISLPSQLVESIIALSIILVAVNNIIPTFRDRTWIILFIFGLFHGMGFASVMQNLPFRMGDLTSLLLCFNVGVELGQIVIVAAVFPIIFLLRKASWYKPVILIGGSLVMIAIAGKWFVERAMGWG